jgi:hypothetical protein
VEAVSVLDHLGQRHNTDKASVWNGRPHDVKGYPHRYLPFYESFFAPLRDREVTVLEIGVETGASLRMWRDYFQRGKVVGLDHQPLAHLGGDRIVVEQGSQRSPGDLARVAAAHGPFDIIVDDAGHETDVQMWCYNYMMVHVKPGGFYVLEDIMDNRVTAMLGQVMAGVVLTQIPAIESIAFSYGTAVTRMRGGAV